MVGRAFRRVDRLHRIFWAGYFATAIGDQRLSLADGCRSRQRAETLSTAVIDSAASGHFRRVVDPSSALRSLLPDVHASRPVQTVRAVIDPEHSIPEGVDRK
jgi:hypothetical protein